MALAALSKLMPKSIKATVDGPVAFKQGADSGRLISIAIIEESPKEG